MSATFDGWLAIATVLIVYGSAESLGSYGFLAVFTAGMAFRRYETTHEYNRRLHDGAETVEKFAELLVVLLIGSVVTFDRLAEPGVAGWALAVGVLILIRAPSVVVSFARSGVTARERAFVAWFGVRGIGSIYYAAFAVGTGILAPADAHMIMWTAIICVLMSIVVHGTTADWLTARLLSRTSNSAGR